MKKHAILFTILLSVNLAKGQKLDLSPYLGINIAPILMTQIDVVYEHPINKHFNALLSGGGVVDAPYGSFYKLGTNKELTKRSGAFLRTGIKAHLDNKIFSPFAGAVVVNSISIEEGHKTFPDSLFHPCTVPNFSSTSYNLGLAGILGFTLKPFRRLKVDIGKQIGILIIDNLVDYHSYAPGMGINWNPMKTQTIMQIRYKLRK